MAMDRATQGRSLRNLSAAPDVMLGSVHALTEDGHLLTASNTGSQLGPYAWGAGKVIWVIGAQKIVTDVSEGLRRIHEYSLERENERLQKAAGRDSYVSKVLITYREATAGRGTAIIVREALGS
jgi:LUD domain